MLLIIILASNANATVVSINSMTLTDSNGGTITINPGSLELVRCYGRLRNNEGLGEIENVTANIFAPSSNYSAPPTAGLKYINNSCDISVRTATTFDYECDVYVHHNIEPGTWTCIIDATDTEGSAQRTGTRTVASTRSFGINDTLLDFGNYVSGSDTGNEDVVLNIYNDGNIYFKPRVDAYRYPGSAGDSNSMTCDNGNIPIGNMRFNMTPNIDIQDKTPMINAVQTIEYYVNATDFGETQVTDSSIYFGIIIPESTTGHCTGIISVTVTS